MFFLIEQSTPVQVLVRNHRADFSVFRHADSVKLAVQVLILQTAFYFPFKRTNPEKSHAIHADIFHGTSKTKIPKARTSFLLTVSSGAYLISLLIH